ncbi:MAG: hypothetical protein R3E44_13515 [Paracoccaceae bacterium]
MTGMVANRPSALGRALTLPVRALLSFVVGTLLCLTPVTSVLVLGWLTTVMRRRAFIVSGLAVPDNDQPRWMFGPRGQGWVVRSLGGLGTNIRSGFGAAFSLLLATFPFSVFWLVAWWAGWENSFNKGYEQAFVGPSVGLAGIAVFAAIMIYLPMGLAHQAVENRALSFFEHRQVRSAVRHAGWTHVGWAFTTLVLALPFFASRGLPAFAEGIYPPIADMTAEKAVELRGALDLAIAAYVFVTLLFLRSWLARIYANAVLRACRGKDADVWRMSPLVPRFGDVTVWRPAGAARLVRLLALLALWTALAVLVFVGQFLNHEWHVWLTHPYVFLPWIT